MTATQVIVKRPQRWDTPLDEGMDSATVERLLSIPPFSHMDESSFSPAVPLRGILENDCRLLQLEEGDIIIRQGDYGHSAFLTLAGSALVALVPLPPEVLGRPAGKKKSWFESLSQLWSNSRVAEARALAAPDKSPIGSRGCGEQTRVFIQDIPRVIDLNQTAEINTGELFGEISALTRTPRTATVVAANSCELLEIRWQGLRELIRRDPALRQHVDALYRENSLRVQLRETPLFSRLSDESIAQLAEHTQFETFGNFEWNAKFKQLDARDVADRINAEPLIAEQGHYADGLILIRGGFARLSRQHGDGHQTIAYLGKGETFGLRELAHNWRTGEQQPWMLSLRAVGYVDVLRIPAATIESIVLPTLDANEMPPPIETHTEYAQRKPERRKVQREDTIETSLLEFLVENRFINGTQAMLIDLDRCTRCDDCIRACAATHDNNPRFVRSGQTHDHWMVANACMHCADPVCMIGCPTGAIGRDAVAGHVLINDQTCIGCGTCANSCPYNNIRMVEIRDRRGSPLIDQATQQPLQKATKCDLCSTQSGGPACQRACPHDALVRIDLTSPTPLYDLTQR